MNNPLVSIIVPIYNTEKYLCRCIDSILCQTYANFELLLINDGSRDNSGIMCDEFAIKDPRVRVFHKQNGGLSSARNLGIQNIKGIYTIFVDSDDFWLESDSLSVLINAAQTFHCDIVRGEYSYVDEYDNFLFNDIKRGKEKYANVLMPSSDFIKQIICGKWMACISLFKSNILLEFNENQKFQEDIDFHIRIFTKTLKCVYVPITFYAYRLRSNSLVNTISPISLKHSFNLCGIFEEYAERCEDYKTTSLYKYYSIMMYYWNLYSLVKLFYNERIDLIREFNLYKIQANISTLAECRFYKYPIVIFFNPKMGCLLLKRYLDLKENIRNLLKPLIK